LFDVANGSRVLINSDMIIDGISQAATGIRAIDGSSVAVTNGRKVTINNCAAAASASNCSMISFDAITGASNTFGMLAYRGSIVTYQTDTLGKSWSNDASGGGLVLTGQNSTDLSDATLDL
jgi:hypothetical protein